MLGGGERVVVCTIGEMEGEKQNDVEEVNQIDLSTPR